MILDLFAGPGGWSEGLRLLGLHDVGIEWDAAACATRAAAGHATIQADVAAYPTEPFVGKVKGLIASPPCQDFSSANGRRLGVVGARGHLVWQVTRWVHALRPAWVACEQVPAVLPVWRRIAHDLEQHGYRTWCGVLNAASYGLPQERLRAVLVARRGAAVAPPDVTHVARPGMFDAAPWVTLADALKLGPGWVYDSGQNSRTAGGGKERYVRSCDRPSGTVTGQTTSQWVLHGPGGERRKLTTEDALGLQGFRRDYPMQGRTEERHQQIGNAVPPPMAAAVIGALVGIERHSEVAA